MCPQIRELEERLNHALDAVASLQAAAAPRRQNSDAAASSRQDAEEAAPPVDVRAPAADQVPARRIAGRVADMLVRQAENLVAGGPSE